MKRLVVYLAVALVSAAVLIFQLALTRIFSATLYYHFAFMAISLALFGSGAGGVSVYLLGDRLRSRDAEWWLGLLSMLFSISTVVSLLVLLRTRLSLEVQSENYGRVLLVYIAAAIPLFFAGALIALAVSRFAEDIGVLYLFDLSGAAVGCLLLIPLLNALGAVNTVLFTALLGSIAAVIFLECGGPAAAFTSLQEKAAARPPHSKSRFAAVSSAVLVAVMLFVNGRTNVLDFRYFKSGFESNLLFAKWNSLSRVSVTGRLNDRHLKLAIDAGAATFIYKDAGIREHWPGIGGDVSALAYYLKRDGEVLVIGPGGGSDVVNARTTRQKKIAAVEINPIIAIDVMSSEPFRSYAGALFQQPDVQLVVDEGRSFIRTSPKQYDIIQATMVDTWAATAAGAFALAENNIYTVEAFEDYWTHLHPDGILTMTRWYFEPPDQMARLVSLTRAMMARVGVDRPDGHVMLVKGFAMGESAPATFLLKKSPFTPGEVVTIEAAAARDGFQILYTPRTRPQNIFTRLMEASEPETIWRQWPTNIAPSYDNNPFFFNNLRPSRLGWAVKGPEEWRKTNLGTVILFWLMAISAVMVLLFILLPLGIARGRAIAGDTPQKLSALVYFVCLGAGFILVEVTMIQKFVLFLGHPVYALAVVLFSLLLFSGMGSAWSSRLFRDDLRRSAARAAVRVAVLILIAIPLLSPIFYGLVHLPPAARIAIAVALIAPLGLAMGMPMPVGIRLLARERPEIIPWAWGVNGAASVMGSVLALAIAILTGFNQALALSAVLYLVAILAVMRSAPRVVA